MKRVIVEVSGGMVSFPQIPPGVEVILIDHDVDGCSPTDDGMYSIPGRKDDLFTGRTEQRSSISADQRPYYRKMIAAIRKGEKE